jgi:hypothetical protein
MYLQLTRVKKVQKSGSYDYDVEYEAEVRDSSADFLSKIGNLELTDLDFSEFSDHNYTVQSITQSYDNTYVDGYKYVLPWKNPFLSATAANTYELNELRPGIYVRKYWDKIFDAAGYTYEFDEKDNFEIQFDKLIIPYNGEDVKVSDDSDLIVEADISNPFSLTSSVSNTLYIGSTPTATTNGFDAPLILDNEITDVSGQYNPVTGIYQPTFTVPLPSVLKFQFTVDYEIYINLPVDATLSKINPSSTNNGVRVKPSLTLRNINNVLYPNVLTQYNIPVGATYSAGSTLLYSDVANIENQISPLFTWAQIKERLRMDVSYLTGGDVLGWKNGSTYYRPTYVVKIKTINMLVVPQDLSLGYNIPVDINQFVPKKIKQSDFIKSIAQMYNLFISVDSDDSTKLIIKTRDQFYDEGVVRDWTSKLAKDQMQDIKFLPELSSKKLILSYKPDNDVANKGYLDNVKEVYGQIEYVYDNEYVKGVDKKELIFSPTPNDITAFDANTPIIDGYQPKNNIRILLDNGVRTCDAYKIRQNGSPVSVSNYPLISHFNDDLNPTFDINYGVCDYYFYNVETTTDNNLYNLHWRRTLGQINNGEMLTAYFNLNNVDIQKLRLNDKIRIDNSYWNINKVIDYNTNGNNLTVVELISIDDELELPPVKTKVIRRPNKGDSPLREVIGAPNIMGPVRPGGLNTILSPLVDVKGTGNYVDNTKGLVVGDDNTIATDGGSVRVNGDGNIINSGADVFGDYNTVEPDSKNVSITGDGNTIAGGLSDIFILGDGINATQSNTITETINGITASTLTSGLPGVLSIDNTTGGNDIIVGVSDKIKSQPAKALNLYSDNRIINTVDNIYSNTVEKFQIDPLLLSGGTKWESYDVVTGEAVKVGITPGKFNISSLNGFLGTYSSVFSFNSDSIELINEDTSTGIKDTISIDPQQLGNGTGIKSEDTSTGQLSGIGVRPNGVGISSTDSIGIGINLDTIIGLSPNTYTSFNTGIEANPQNTFIHANSDSSTASPNNELYSYAILGRDSIGGTSQFFGGIYLGNNRVNPIASGSLGLGFDGVIINSVNSNIPASIPGVVILGGNGITASTSNMVYVPNLNIQTLGTASPVNNVGIDAGGNLVIGTTGGSVPSVITTYTSSGVIATDISLIDSTGGVMNMVLPNATGFSASKFTIKDKVGNALVNNIIINATASQVIDGSSTYTMTLNWESITLLSDGNNWFIV